MKIKLVKKQKKDNFLEKQFFDRLENDVSMPTYYVGVYGPRNVCIRCQNELSILYSFVSNMSTGFSGNLGFPMPENWAFGQFFETSIGSGNGYLEIDKNDYSGKDKGAEQFTPHVVEERTTEEKAVFDNWQRIVENTYPLSDYYFLISPQFNFDQTYVLVDTSFHRIEVTSSVEYTHRGEIEGVTLNVTDGEIEGSIEENLGEDSSLLTSVGLSLVEDYLNSAAIGIDNGRIGITFEIQDDGIYCHIDLYNEDIETETDKLNLISRVTAILKWESPDIPQEQLDSLRNLSIAVGAVLAVIIIIAVGSSSTVAGALAVIFAAFTITSN